MKIEGLGNAGGQAYSAPEVKSTVSAPETVSEVAVSAAVQVENFSSQPQDGTQRKNVPSESTVKQAVSDINKRINPNTIARYGYHEETNRVTIKIVDKDSDKVIKEFPAEETLDMIAKVWELAGVFLDERG